MRAAAGRIIAVASAAALAACARAPARPAAPAMAAPVGAPKVYQWLQGSGEAAVIQRQSYAAFARYVLAAAAARARGQAVEGAVLAPGTTPAAPAWAACGDRPAAVVLDMDETAILNSGANYDSARRGDPPFDAARWSAWERTGAALVDPLPGAVDALRAVRAAGVTPIFISNRQGRFAAQAVAALDGAGLGPAEHGRTLFLSGDVAPGSGKDPRRARVARDWCVLAMAGDQLGDFSDRFNAPGLAPLARRALALSPALAAKWNAGWFLLPNPAYGPGDAGTAEEVVPPARRWPGPGGAP